MRSSERPSKQEAFLALLREGWASLHLDARREGVVVPSHLRAEAHLVLQYGYDLQIPIPDLEIDEHGVRATLSFSKSPQQTVVPWSAVYVVACDDGRAILYQEDVPEDVSIIAAPRAPEDGAPDEEIAGLTSGRRAARAAPGTSGGTGRISERALRSVPDEGAPQAAGDLPNVDGELQNVGSGARRRRKPMLRLVK